MKPSEPPPQPILKKTAFEPDPRGFVLGLNLVGIGAVIVLLIIAWPLAWLRWLIPACHGRREASQSEVFLRHDLRDKWHFSD